MSMPGKKLKTCSSKFAWWVEEGAFISMLPRQSGKTEMLIRMAKIFQSEKEDFVFAVHHSATKINILRRFPINSNKVEVITGAIAGNMFDGMENISDTHLLVDEYMYVNKNSLKAIISQDWKSISMVGGLYL